MSFSGFYHFSWCSPLFLWGHWCPSEFAIIFYFMWIDHRFIETKSGCGSGECLITTPDYHGTCKNSCGGFGWFLQVWGLFLFKLCLPLSCVTQVNVIAWSSPLEIKSRIILSQWGLCCYLVLVRLNSQHLGSLNICTCPDQLWYWSFCHCSSAKTFSCPL